MAGRPKKVTEVSDDTQEVEIVETVEGVEIENIELPNNDTENDSLKSEEEVVSIEFSKETPSEPLVEVEYQPKDIVEFYNLKGELRYAPYAYITKRGYTALRKYTKKK